MVPAAKIALISPCGWGNLGDEAILHSLIHGIRARVPGARLLAFTQNPEDTARRHSIEAHTLIGFSVPHYGMAAPGAAAAPAMGGSPSQRIGSRSIVSSAIESARKIVPRGALRAVLAAPLRAAEEAPHLKRSLALLEGCTAVVVAGGGQLDDLFGGAFGHPYALLRWGLLARGARAPFSFLSVGTGRLATPLSRFFIHRALALAQYRSFRDARSRELAGAPRLVGSDPIVPDLAYGLPLQQQPAPRRERLTVGLSPMAFCDPRQWPVDDAARYRRHVRSFGAIAAGLARQGHEVVLFATDGEPQALEDTRAEAVQGDPAAAALVRIEPADSVPSLFALLARLDLVVAARLHGVLLSHLALRPTLAIAHERKVRTLMEETGQRELCLDIDALEAPEALERIRKIATDRERLVQQIAASVAERRRQVEDQYDRLFLSRVSSAAA